jgi:hypothetical protein
VTTALHRTQSTRSKRVRFAISLFAAAAFAIALAVVPGPSAGPVSAAPITSQCNSVDNTPGLKIECDVTVENTLNAATGAATTKVTSRECHGVANTANPLCTTIVESSNALTTSISQCNYAVNGGGANVICHVKVTNRIIGIGAAVPATVNQCNGSGAEGTAPTLLCDPADATTTNATITQCNDSANGGGAAERVQCSVGESTEASALPVSVNQCNNSANGGGSTVVCSVSMANIFAAVEGETPPPAPETPTTPGAPTTPTTPTTPGSPATPETPAAPGGSGTPSGADGGGTPQAPGTTERPTADKLASTGFDAAPSVLIGSLTLLLGATLVLVDRQRRRSVLA